MRFAVEIEGDGDAVVLLHDIGQSHEAWDGVSRELRPHDFRVIRYDARGHGRTSKPNTGYSFLDAAHDLRAVMRQVESGPAHLVGDGTGAGAVIAFALRWPEMVRSIMLIGPVVGGWRWSPDWIGGLREVIRVFREESMENGRRVWIGLPRFKEARADPLVEHSLRNMAREWDGRALWSPADNPPPKVRDMDRVSELEMPAMIIVGRREHPEIRNLAQHLAEAMPNGVLEDWDHKGGCLPLSDPGPIAAAIVRHVNAPIFARVAATNPAATGGHRVPLEETDPKVSGAYPLPLPALPPPDHSDGDGGEADNGGLPEEPPRAPESVPMLNVDLEPLEED